MSELPDAGTFGYQLSEHIADAAGDKHADVYLAAVVGELMELVPGLRERFSNRLMEELKEAIAHREDPRYAHATIALIEQIENDWRNNV